MARGSTYNCVNVIASRRRVAAVARNTRGAADASLSISAACLRFSRSPIDAPAIIAATEEQNKITLERDCGMQTIPIGFAMI